LIQQVTNGKKFSMPQFLRISEMLRTRRGENIVIETS